MIVEYKNDNVRFDGNKTPEWVTNGGNFFDPDNYTYIGFIDSDHAHKVPETVKVLSGAAELKERCQDLHVRYPFIDSSDYSTLTTGEVDTLVDDTITARDIGGAGTPSKLRAGQAAIINTDSPYSIRSQTRTLLIDASAGNITVDIPTAVGCSGLRFTFINSVASGANTVTLDPAGTETINGATTDTGLDAQYDTMTIESDGANWLKV